MKRPFKRHFSTKGRATRKEYWLFILFSILIVISVTFAFCFGGYLLGANAISSAISGDVYTGMIGISAMSVTIGSIFYFGFFGLVMSMLSLIVPFYCISVRRLHDRGKSAWGMLWALIPILGILFLWGYFLLNSRPDNKYGPNPKEISIVEKEDLINEDKIN